MIQEYNHTVNHSFCLSCIYCMRKNIERSYYHADDISSQNCKWFVFFPKKQTNSYLSAFTA